MGFYFADSPDSSAWDAASFVSGAGGPASGQPALSGAMRLAPPRFGVRRRSARTPFGNRAGDRRPGCLRGGLPPPGLSFAAPAN
jgi:hypothetical protein